MLSFCLFVAFASLTMFVHMFTICVAFLSVYFCYWSGEICVSALCLRHTDTHKLTHEMIENCQSESCAPWKLQFNKSKHTEAESFLCRFFFCALSLAHCCWDRFWVTWIRWQLFILKTKRKKCDFNLRFETKVHFRMWNDKWMAFASNIHFLFANAVLEVVHKTLSQNISN